MKSPLLIALFVSTCAIAQPPATSDINASDLGRTHRVIGALGRPLGASTYLRGLVIDGPKGTNRAGPNIQVQKINGVATQENIQLPLTPYLGTFDDGDVNIARPEIGKSFEFFGYETGGFAGVPRPVVEVPGVRHPSPDHQFVPRFAIVNSTSIEPLRLGPADFIGRLAVLLGTAKSRDGKAWLMGDGWEIKVLDQAWSAPLEGKVLEGRGIVRQVTGAFEFEGGSATFARLDDQVGRGIMLRGIMRGGGTKWWFEYRGTPVLIDDLAKVSGFNTLMLDRAVLVRGTLQRRTPPDNATGPAESAAFIIVSAVMKEVPPLLVTESQPVP